MKKVNLTALLLFFVLLVSAADIPDTYYTVANGKSDSVLKSSLHRVIKVGSRLGYGSGCSSTWGGFATSDVTPDGKVWDMYSDNRPSFSSSCAAASGMNIEHSFAKSWWGGANNNAYKDLFHLNPSNSTANSQRGNRPPGVVVTPKFDNGSFKVGRNPAYGDFDVFKPADEYKGDFARAYFYMATCYEEFVWRLDNKDVGSYYVMRNDSYKEFLPWFTEILLQWHRQDPVSQKEIDRLAAITAIQSNRNPFIDYPCLVEYIWGNKQGEVVDFARLMSSVNPNYLSNDDKSGCSCEITDPTITSPRKNATVNVGAANLNEALTTTINVQGVLLTQNVSLAITGTNASLFKVSTVSLTASQVLNSVDVIVTYTPTALGQHAATLTISSSELATSTIVNLTGSCLATLTSPTTQGVAFSGSDATLTQQQDVIIKGTNLANTVTLALSGSDAAKFTLSKSTLTASEVNAGQTITLAYKPETINAHVATLTVSSNDFTSVVVPITGECTFEALDATNVSLSGFTANWTNAGAANYELDVYTKDIVGTKLDTLLLETPLSAAKITANAHLSSSGSTYDDNGSFRLGTGSGDGVVKITGLDMSAGATLTINAKAYGSDASQLKVGIGANVIDNIILTSAFVDYTMSVTASATDIIELSQAVTGKRINIAGLFITTGGQVITKTSLVGYPQTLGAVCAHNVAVPMSADQPYYYTVKPTAVNQSEEIEVLYGSTSGNVDINQDLGVVCLNSDRQIHLLNLPESSQVRIFDVMGRVCDQRTNCLAEERFNVPSKGVYMIQILYKGTYYTIKTLTF